MGGMKFAMVAFLVLLGLFIALDSQGADFYQYETDDGTIVMTDDPKRIPESFQETVRSRSFEELGDVRWTPVTEPGDLHVPTPLADEKNPNRQETCDQPVRSDPSKELLKLKRLDSVVEQRLTSIATARGFTIDPDGRVLNERRFVRGTDLAELAEQAINEVNAALRDSESYENLSGENLEAAIGQALAASAFDPNDLRNQGEGGLATIKAYVKRDMLGRGYTYNAREVDSYVRKELDRVLASAPWSDRIDPGADTTEDRLWEKFTKKVPRKDIRNHLARIVVDARTRTDDEETRKDLIRWLVNDTYGETGYVDELHEAVKILTDPIHGKYIIRWAK